MPKKLVQVEVESSGYEVVQLVTKVVVAAKHGGSPEALTVAVGELVQLVQSLQSLPADAQEDVKELLKGVNLAAWDLAEALLAK